MKLYFVRHGETQSNIEHKATGQTDSSLTEKGTEDAQTIAAMLPQDFDLIYSSDLGRCKITTGILNEKLNAPVKYDRRLRERHFGSLEGKVISQVDMTLYKNDHNQVYDYRPYGGESVDDVKKRVFDFVEDMKKNNKNSKILIVTHGGVIRLLHHLLHGKIPEKIHNASLHEFDFPDN